MTSSHPPPPGAINIGEESKPPFAVLPDPGKLYQRRSQRFAALAPAHQLRDYLSFLADLTRAQHAIVPSLPIPPLPAADALATALAHAMPPLSADALLSPTAEATFDALLAEVAKLSLPPRARTAVTTLTSAAPAVRRALLGRALTGDLASTDVAELSLAMAALQVHASRLAARLDAAALKPIADGICPACGSPPASSAVVGWPGAHNLRYCLCSLCSTHWNVVRVKCALCSGTEGIKYRTIEGQPEAVKAETCDTCRRYLKILYQVHHPEIEEFADDVATLGLDVLLAEEDFTRGGRNLFLLGY